MGNPSVWVFARYNTTKLPQNQTIEKKKKKQPQTDDIIQDLKFIIGMKYDLQQFDLKHNWVDDKIKPKLYKPIANKPNTTIKQL